jgi:hypothetical protein
VNSEQFNPPVDHSKTLRRHSSSSRSAPAIKHPASTPIAAAYTKFCCAWIIKVLTWQAS